MDTKFFTRKGQKSVSEQLQDFSSEVKEKRKRGGGGGGGGCSVMWVSNDRPSPPEVWEEMAAQLCVCVCVFHPSIT